MDPEVHTDAKALYVNAGLTHQVFVQAQRDSVGAGDGMLQIRTINPAGTKATHRVPQKTAKVFGVLVENNEELWVVPGRPDSNGNKAAMRVRLCLAAPLPPRPPQPAVGRGNSGSR